LCILEGLLQFVLPLPFAVSCFVVDENVGLITQSKPDVLVDCIGASVWVRKLEFVGNNHTAPTHASHILVKSKLTTYDVLVHEGVEQVHGPSGHHILYPAYVEIGNVVGACCIDEILVLRRHCSALNAGKLRAGTCFSKANCCSFTLLGDCVNFCLDLNGQSKPIVLLAFGCVDFPVVLSKGLGLANKAACTGSIFSKKPT